MSGFSLSFQPWLSWPVFWGLCAVAGLLALALIYLRRRGWPLRLFSLALVLSAIANPLFSTEDRQPLSDIVAVVVDDSDSQNIGKRREQTAAALAEMEKRLAALGNTEMRLARTVTGTTADSDGTRVFAALEKLVERIPAERFGGAIIISDGQIHDVPAKLSPQLAKGPLQALGLGLVWGWLPCGLVYSALAWSLVSGGALEGARIMLAFGLGTLPMLLAMGTAARWLKQVTRMQRVRQVAGTVILSFGLYMLFATGGHNHPAEISGHVHTH